MGVKVKNRNHLWLVIALLIMAYPGEAKTASQYSAYLPIVVTTDNPKHGLAWSWGSDSTNAGVELGASWYYHWAARGWSHVPAEIEFVPMLWGDTRALRTKFLLSVPSETRYRRGKHQKW